MTEFEFRLHEVGPEVAVGQAYVLREHAAETLAFYRDFAEQAPDEVACYALALRIPPIDVFPAEHHGVVSFVAPMEYAVLQSSFDAGAPDGGRYYYKTGYTSGLPDEAIEAIVGTLDPFPGDFTMLGIEPLGGTVNRLARDATAFPTATARSWSACGPAGATRATTAR